MGSERKVFQKKVRDLGGTKKNGKFSSFATKNGVQNVNKVFEFESLKSYYPFIYFQTEKTNYIGIVLARQSSDFLKMLINQFITHKKSEMGIDKNQDLNLIQYKFPRDPISILLLIMVEWKSLEDFDSVTSNLQKIQTGFLNALKESANNLMLD